MKYLLKLSLTFIAFSFIFSSCSDSVDDNDPSSEVDDISILLDVFEGTGLTFEVTYESVIFTTADLPNHTSPYWEISNELYEAYNGTST